MFVVFFFFYLDEIEFCLVFEKKFLVWEEDVEFYLRFMEWKVRGVVVSLGVLFFG